MNPPDSPQENASNALPVGTLIVLEPLTYSVSETAQVLGIAEVSVYRLIARRYLKPVPHLRCKRISKKQVHAYAEGQQGL